MSRGCSFEPTKSEREATIRRERVKSTVLRLLEAVHNVSAQDVYASLDHTTPPYISPANSGNILALLAREGILADVMGVRTDGSDRLKREKGVVLYTLPPRKRSVLPVYESTAVRPLTKEELMVGRVRPRRPRYVSMMELPCVDGDTSDATPSTQINQGDVNASAKP